MKRSLWAVLAATALGVSAPSSAYADGCYICTSGSSCSQCAYRGADTQENRKRCREAGCKIGGTKSCSTAANVKTCRASLRDTGPRHAAITALEELTSPRPVLNGLGRE